MGCSAEYIASEGGDVRLSGQDMERETFCLCHSVIHDQVRWCDVTDDVTDYTSLLTKASQPATPPSSNL